MKVVDPESKAGKAISTFLPAIRNKASQANRGGRYSETGIPGNFLIKQQQLIVIVCREAEVGSPPESPAADNQIRAKIVAW